MMVYSHRTKLVWTLMGAILFCTPRFLSAKGVCEECVNSNRQDYQQISFDTTYAIGAVPSKAVNVFKRLLLERTGRDFFLTENKDKHSASLLIKLVIDSVNLEAESYLLEQSGKSTIRITGGDGRGLLYGVGKFLHTSKFDHAHFSPSKVRGLIKPDKPFRDIYFATHFGNFYHKAPIEKVAAYIEELALWGYNGLMVWFDMHHFNGIQDPDAQEMLDRLASMLRVAKSVGMRTDLTMLANEGYKNSPKELRADPRTASGWHYHVEICPSIPEGRDLILTQVKEELDEFKKRGIVPNGISLWPYDQGGCACELCAPYGSNGYLRITRDLSEMIRKDIPGVEILLSTWLFDYKKDIGEWTGLAKAFEQNTPWVDYIMADSHEQFPRYPLENAVPGNLPLLNFPEISMWGNWPWGGFGANPLPQRFQMLWNEVSDKVSGGYPYSEGIYEDMNKVIYSQFYWETQRGARDILKEYISFEFSNRYVEEILTAIDIVEQNTGLSTRKWFDGVSDRIEVPKFDHGSKKAYDLLKMVNEELPRVIRESWRWKLLYLRAFLDYELRKEKGVPNKAINDAFREIRDIQYLQDAEYSVYPPVDADNIYPFKTKNKYKSNLIF